jgi:lipopolysaccharide transport system permease protein
MPISAATAPLVDFGIAFFILLGMMAWYKIMPTWGVLVLPVFLLLALTTALTVSLFLSALNVRYRDVGYTIPFLVQFWMYVSPVAYPVSVVPEKWRTLYSLNPMAGVIEGFRWALLGKEKPDFVVMAVGAVVLIALLFCSILYFKHVEQNFADFV